MRITLPSGTPAELARPEGEPTRGMVVIPDIGGLRPLFDDHVARLARDYGWATIASEPFPGRESMSLPDRLAAVKDLDDDTQLSDIIAAADALDVEPVGVLGFCMGGMFTLKAAATGRFDKAAAFYGMIRLPPDWKDGKQRDAIDTLKAAPGSAERVLAIIGTADPFTPPDDVADLEALGATVIRYEGAEHGFVHDPSRPTHRADDADDAWRRVAAWFSGPGSSAGRGW